MFMRTGSLVAAWPGGMVTQERLSKVSLRMVPAAAVGLLGAAASASEACVIVSGRALYRLESWMRAPVPPMLVWMTFRIDMPERPRSVFGSAAAADPDQVPTPDPRAAARADGDRGPTQDPDGAGAAELGVAWAASFTSRSRPPTPANIAVETRTT